MSAHRPANHPGKRPDFPESVRTQSHPRQSVWFDHDWKFFPMRGYRKRQGARLRSETDGEYAITNALDEGVFYSLSGHMIAMNDGSAPVITYHPDEVLRIGEATPPPLDLTNRSATTGLGFVEERREVETNDGDGEPQLEERCHRAFKVKYVVPGTKNMVKTHVLYVVGREVQLIGHVVDWDIENEMAVVLVKGVSLTNGHKEVRSPLKASASGSTPGKNGRNFYQFGKKPKTPTTPMASGSGTKVAESPLKGKGKIEEPPASDKENDTPNEDEEDGVVEATGKRGRGRPRKIAEEPSKKHKED
ncbi:hypothetical protein PSHT_14407 [Puccinia striiformis]|uniref:RPA43 OB domain-containing protein n=2 Tax=Puccinia striiformis TaxID=27350 RepID=A0A2S4W5L5_9BASI|nr:hypothetical protein PSHT_14407 [Puccinia striiformis]POW17058.1 hypothetical protein PSTT_00909 [Puccinia striiformis]